MTRFNITNLLILLIAFVANATVTVAAEPTLAVERVKYQVLPRLHYASAVIEAVHQATVSAQTSGRITEINFDVDDFVPQGSVLLRFRNKKQKATLKEAQASVKEAETRLEQSRLEYERIKDVFNKKLVAKSMFDTASADYKAAGQRLSQMRARLTQAQEGLDRTIVKAPYDGIVVKRHVEVGETAKVGQALLSGFSMESVRAIAKVPQSLIGLVNTDADAVNSTYIIYSDSKNAPLLLEKKVVATRVTINPYGDPVTHTFNVRVQLPSGLQGIYPGMFVKVAFVSGEDRFLLVPHQAVVIRGEVSAVYVVKPDGHISFRQIRVANTFVDGVMKILSGLEEGEQVALDPIQAGIQLKEQRVSGNGT